MELSYKDLKRDIYQDIKKLGIKSAEDILPGGGLIGQERAAAALKLGLAVKRRDYNIFVSGHPGCGRTTFAEYFAREQAKNEPAPPDLCYVYNFNEPKQPLLLSLTAGTGARLRDDMISLVDEAADKLERVFSSLSYGEEEATLTKSFSNRRDKLVKIISEKAEGRGFGVKLTSSGLFFMPLVKGEPLSEEQYEKLSSDEKNELNQKSDEIQAEASSLLHEIKSLDSEIKDKSADLEYRTALRVIGKLFAPMLAKYEDSPEITAYLKLAKEDMLNHYRDFFGDEEEENALSAILPVSVKKAGQDPLAKYKINLFVDNSAIACAPVISSRYTSYASFIGDMEFESEYGNFSTDFMKIKPGLLQRANGGYLILQGDDVFASHSIWSTVKRLIKTGEVQLEPLKEYTTGLTVSSVKPKPLRLNVKIIVVGSNELYGILNEFEDDFQKLFKINAQFDSELDFTDTNLGGLFSYIAGYINREMLKPFELSAYVKIAEHLVRLSANRKKLSAQFNLLTELLAEASHIAENSVTGETVAEALISREYRNNLYEHKLNELLNDDVIMIDTSGSQTGQINGLSVIMTHNHVFGKPSRITATSYIGKAGVINIEKEAKMSGSTHDKGVEVISGYLGQSYAQEFPMSLSCRLCFEQNYGGIDGDSASSTELYAILSSLSGLPISQQIAVTGSVNQRGEIQAIGGVSEKIEGFFDLCHSRTLTGEQGVIIPAQNASDLCLKDDVIAAVKAKKFHIYAIRTIDEGIELLTGKKAGKRGAKGKYPPDSVHGLVMKKLKSYHRLSAPAN